MKLTTRLTYFWLLCLTFLLWTGAAFALGVNDLEARTYTDANGKTLPYRLFVPKDLDPNWRYPLVLFLHGAGERGTDNAAQLSHPSPLVFAEKQKCFFVAPQCPGDQQWVNTPWGNGSYSVDNVAISDPLRMAIELIQSLQKDLPIDEKRLYITGLSMGGYGTWDAITRYPHLFAAAVPICGGGDPSKAATLNEPGIWAFHSADDNIVPVSGSRDMIRALWAAGRTPSYTEYLTYGHGSWDAAYATPDLVNWVFTFHK